jgi:NAD(P)H-hydrate epimerase
LGTAGSGDVLSGIIASLIAQNYKSFDAACIGCYLHSQSAMKINKSLTAKDIINILPKIIKNHQY